MSFPLPPNVIPAKAGIHASGKPTGRMPCAPTENVSGGVVDSGAVRGVPRELRKRPQQGDRPKNYGRERGENVSGDSPS